MPGGTGCPPGVGHRRLEDLGGRGPSCYPESSSFTLSTDRGSKPANTVLLSESKLKAAKVTTAQARYDLLKTELGVPGRIEVNADRRIEIRPRASGVIREVHAFPVRPSSAVIHSSPWKVPIWVRQAQPPGQAARTQHGADRGAMEIPSRGHGGLLIPEIRKGTDPAAIEKEFADKPLGSYRGSLLQAYAEFDIASHEEEKTAGLRREEVIGEHPAVLAMHTRQGVQAKLYAAIEQVKFDAAQAKRLADQQVRKAESDVIDAAQRLRILGVHEDIRDLLDHADKADTLAVNEDVTVYRINAPFDGTIIRKDAVASQKADLNDVLFTVADLKTVWVTANIAESDVASVPKIRGGAIRLSATAYGTRCFRPSFSRSARWSIPRPERSRSWPRPTTTTACSSRACSSDPPGQPDHGADLDRSPCRRGRDRGQDRGLRSRQDRRDGRGGPAGVPSCPSRPAARRATASSSSRA